MSMVYLNQSNFVPSLNAADRLYTRIKDGN